MKKILYVIIAIVLVYLVLCIFGPASVQTSQTVSINAPKELVQKQLANLQFFHDSWSPWTEKDPEMKVTYAGESGMPGSVYSWESDKKGVGKGSMTLARIVGDSTIFTLHFDGMGDSKVYMLATDSAGATNVTWGLGFDIGFMGRGPMLFMNIGKQMKPDFDKGLSKLKAAVEAMTTTTPTVTYEIKELQWEPKTFVGKKGKMTFDKLSGFFAENYPKLSEAMAKAKVEAIGAPKALYFSYDQKEMTTECAAVMEVPAKTKVAGWENFESPAGKVLLIEYYGAYDKSAKAHYAMDRYMQDNKLAQNMVMEEYITDPMVEKDTTKWLTNIYYFIK